MLRIAIKTLLADRGKLSTALVGVVFSVVLVNLQAGLFLGLIRKAGLLADKGEAQIWIGHKSMHNIDFPVEIPIHWAERLRGLQGVSQAEPILVGWTHMSLPSGGYEHCVVVGVDRTSLLGSAWNVTDGDGRDIRNADGIILDRLELEKLENPKLGEVRELGGKRAKIVAMSDGIMGFLVAPYCFTTIDNARGYLKIPRDSCSYILVVVDPTNDVHTVKQAIQTRLPDAEVLTREEYSKVSADFWMTRTGLGISFGGAAFLGLLVGLVMVAQALYALVLDRISEFATLKAIGASDAQVLSILLYQAGMVAAIGSCVGIGIAHSLRAAFSTPKAPIELLNWVQIGSCILVLGICLISSVLPYLRVRRVDPVSVLRS